MPKKQKRPPTNLNEFLVSPDMSVSKEMLLMHKLLYDMKLVAAIRGYHLETYTADVDREGFDLIVDDQDHLMKLQIKTAKDGSTKRWKIRKRMLRPPLYAIEDLGFELSPSGEGLEGGALVISWKVKNDDISTRYYYTDAFVLSAFICEIISPKNKKTQEAIRRVNKEIKSGVGFEKIDINRSLFLAARSPKHLFGLMGMHGPMSTNWKRWLREYSRGEFSRVNDNSFKRPQDKLKQDIHDELAGLAILPD